MEKKCPNCGEERNIKRTTNNNYIRGEYIGSCTKCTCKMCGYEWKIKYTDLIRFVYSESARLYIDNTKLI